MDVLELLKDSINLDHPLLIVVELYILHILQHMINYFLTCLGSSSLGVGAFGRYRGILLVSVVTGVLGQLLQRASKHVQENAKAKADEKNHNKYGSPKDKIYLHAYLAFIRAVCIEVVILHFLA